MSVIDVPGDELERVHDLLQRISDLMNSNQIRNMGAEVDTLGHRDLEKAGHHFEKRWGDGRHVVGKDMEGVRDAAKAVADAFKEADEQTGAALTPDTPTPAAGAQAATAGALLQGIQAATRGALAQGGQAAAPGAVLPEAQSPPLDVPLSDRIGVIPGPTQTEGATLPEAQTAGATLPEAQTAGATLPEAQTTSATLPDAQIGEKTLRNAEL